MRLLVARIGLSLGVAFCVSAHAQASPWQDTAPTDISAQQKKNNPPPRPAARPAPPRVNVSRPAPRPAVRSAPAMRQPRVVNQPRMNPARVNPPRVNPTRVGPPGITPPRINQQRAINPNVNQPRLRNNVVTPGSRPGPAVRPAGNVPLNRNAGGGPGGPRILPLAAQRPLQRGPGRPGPAISRPVNMPMAHLANNRVAPIFRAPRRMFFGGRWRTFVPYTALGAVLLGGSYYYADGYLAVARPYCAGISPDGCRLNWQSVEFEDGGSDWQCVQYCARPGALPPPRAMALVEPPPPATGGACEITIYPEPDFAGTAVTTGEEQPRLSESGWQDQIASVQVASGTWDVFSDENYTGTSLRLEPGQYPTLGPEWTKHSGSFMCVQP